jgi:hypothetical protein
VTGVSPTPTSANRDHPGLGGPDDDQVAGEVAENPALEARLEGVPSSLLFRRTLEPGRIHPTSEFEESIEISLRSADEYCFDLGQVNPASFAGTRHAR